MLFLSTHSSSSNKQLGCATASQRYLAPLSPTSLTPTLRDFSVPTFRSEASSLKTGGVNSQRFRLLGEAEHRLCEFIKIHTFRWWWKAKGAQGGLKKIKSKSDVLNSSINVPFKAIFKHKLFVCNVVISICLKNIPLLCTLNPFLFCFFPHNQTKGILGKCYPILNQYVN